MKQKDIALIIVVATFSLVIAAVSSNFIFGRASLKEQKAERTEAISAEFSPPSNVYFNDQSVDPTVIIRTGEGENQTPFKQAE